MPTFQPIKPQQSSHQTHPWTIHIHCRWWNLWITQYLCVVFVQMRWWQCCGWTTSRWCRRHGNPIVSSAGTTAAPLTWTGYDLPRCLPPQTHPAPLTLVCMPELNTLLPFPSAQQSPGDGAPTPLLSTHPRCSFLETIPFTYPKKWFWPSCIPPPPPHPQDSYWFLAWCWKFVLFLFYCGTWLHPSPPTPATMRWNALCWCQSDMDSLMPCVLHVLKSFGASLCFKSS